MRNIENEAFTELVVQQHIVDARELSTMNFWVWLGHLFSVCKCYPPRQGDEEEPIGAGSRKRKMGLVLDNLGSLYYII